MSLDLGNECDRWAKSVISPTMVWEAIHFLPGLQVLYQVVFYHVLLVPSNMPGSQVTNTGGTVCVCVCVCVCVSLSHV